MSGKRDLSNNGFYVGIDTTLHAGAAAPRAAGTQRKGNQGSPLDPLLQVESRICLGIDTTLHTGAVQEYRGGGSSCKNIECIDMNS